MGGGADDGVRDSSKSSKCPTLIPRGRLYSTDIIVGWKAPTETKRYRDMDRKPGTIFPGSYRQLNAKSRSSSIEICSVKSD